MGTDLARMLIVSGLLIAGVGAAALAADRVGLGRLPGDLRFGGDGFRVEIPSPPACSPRWWRRRR